LPTRSAPTSRTWTAVREMLAVIQKQPAVSAAVLVYGVLLFVAPSQALLVPICVTSVLQRGAEQLGVLFAASGIGTVVGSLFVALFGHYQRKGSVSVGECSLGDGSRAFRAHTEPCAFFCHVAANGGGTERLHYVCDHSDAGQRRRQNARPDHKSQYVAHDGRAAPERFSGERRHFVFWYRQHSAAFGRSGGSGWRAGCNANGSWFLILSMRSRKFTRLPAKDERSR
jgi:hypothetical protein